MRFFNVDTINIIIILIVLLYILYFFNYEKAKSEKKYFSKKIGKFTVYLKNKREYIKYFHIFNTPINYWTSVINNNKNIDLYITVEDQNTSYIARSNILSSDINNLTNKGEIIINKKTFCKLDESKKMSVIQHEIAHILGVGNKWEITYDVTNGPYLDKDTYPYTMTSYVSVTGISNNLGIPVENEGGKGVSNIHWENQDRYFDGIETKGLKNELLTSSLENKPVMSPITLNNLKDLGWDINIVGVDDIDFNLPRRLLPLMIN